MHNVHSFRPLAEVEVKVHFPLSRCQCATLIRIVVDDWGSSSIRPHDRWWTISRMIEEGPLAWSEAISSRSARAESSAITGGGHGDLCDHALGQSFPCYYQKALQLTCCVFGHSMRQLDRERERGKTMSMPSLRLLSHRLDCELVVHRSSAADHSLCQKRIWLKW